MSFILWSMGLVLAFAVGQICWTICFYAVLAVIKIVIDHPIAILKGLGWSAFGLLALVMGCLAFAKQMGAF